MSNEEIKFLSILVAIVGGIIAWIGKLYLDTRIKRLEYNNDIHTFRYTKLFELNIEINNLPDIDYTMIKINADGNIVQDKDKVFKVLGKSTERFSTFTKIFQKVKALLDKSIILEINRLIKEEKNQNDKIVHSKSRILNTNDVYLLLEIRYNLEEELKNIIVLQLRLLIKRE